MSVTALHVLYKKEFEPIVRPLEYVALMNDVSMSKWIFGKVIFIEPLQPITINLGSLSAADPNRYPTPGTTKTLDSIAVGDNEFAQYRIKVLDDFLLEIKLPPALSRFINRNGPTYVQRISRDQLTEIFVYKDDVPTVQPYSILFTDLEVARIMVYGFRYVFVKLSEDEKRRVIAEGKYTVIPISGITTVTRG